MTQSARLGIPLLESGQIDKATTHNEAIALLDLAVGAAVDGVLLESRLRPLRLSAAAISSAAVQLAPGQATPMHLPATLPGDGVSSRRSRACPYSTRRRARW